MHLTLYRQKPAAEHTQVDRGAFSPGISFSYTLLALSEYPESSSRRPLAEGGTETLPFKISCLSTSAPYKGWSPLLSA